MLGTKKMIDNGIWTSVFVIGFAALRLEISSNGRNRDGFVFL